MLETVLSSARQLLESDIERFETKNRIQLPESYRRFLLRHNGGVPKQDAFLLSSHREKEMDVHFFLGIDNEDEHLQLQWHHDFNLENRTDPIFADLFEIAYDSFGDPICLDLSAGRYGAVIFIDVVPIWKDCTEKDIYVVANSFPEFLEMLYEAEDED
jgi:cell wall assembly regulator SMI1